MARLAGARSGRRGGGAACDAGASDRDVARSRGWPSALARTREFFEAEAERLARLCHRMAERFARGGRLIAFGRSPAARSDVRHVAVEFVHPVIVGKRALPAIGLAGEGGPLDRAGGAGGRARRHRDRLRRRGRPRRARRGRARARLPDDRVRAARARSGSSRRRAADPSIAPGARRDALPRAVGARARVLRPPRPARGPRGAARARRGRLELPLPVPRRAARTTSRRSSRTCARSVLAKASEVGELRAQTLTENRDELAAAAAALRARLDAGGRLLALGNGGSATDAMDAVADFRARGRAGRRAGARPHRGRGDPDRDRERHRRRGDLRAPGDRLRARRATCCWRSRRAATRRT